jgi:hypothetical protein
MKAQKSSGQGRTRNWGGILYPDSLPENYLDILNESHIKWALSPLHNKDLNADGEHKKDHRHLILVYDTVKSFEQVKELTDKLHGTVPQKLNSLVGAVRYFTHKDNPEKAPYDEKDILCGNGFELEEILKKTTTEKKAIVKEIYEFIKNNDIIEFHELTDYAYEHNADWFDVLMEGHTMVFNAVIKSRRHSEKLQLERVEREQKKAFEEKGIEIDEETGEVKNNDVL